MRSMVIHVIGDDTIASQVRIYAEFRFFAILARYARFIRDVDVILRTTVGPEAAGAVTCAVDVKLAQSESLHASATDPHASGAIDRAAHRIDTLMSRRQGQI